MSHGSEFRGTLSLQPPENKCVFGWCGRPGRQQNYSKNQKLGLANSQNPAVDIIGKKNGLANCVSVDLTKENAASGASDHGVNNFVKRDILQSKEYQARLDSATVLAHAIADCDPRDACKIMAAALSDLSVGSPIAPFVSIMAEAREWAACASTPQHKAYAVACYNELSPRDQAAFYSHVSSGVAA